MVGGGALWSESLGGAELLNTALHKACVFSMNCCEERKLDLLNKVNYINFDRDYECVIKLCVKLMTIKLKRLRQG